MTAVPAIALTVSAAAPVNALLRQVPSRTAAAVARARDRRYFWPLATTDTALGRARRGTALVLRSTTMMRVESAFVATDTLALIAACAGWAVTASAATVAARQPATASLLARRSPPWSLLFTCDPFTPVRASRIRTPRCSHVNRLHYRRPDA